MTFKDDWEKSDQKITLTREAILQMTLMAFPENKLQSYEIISGGCANLNIKINLESECFILRIYLRDKEAPSREKQLGNLIGRHIPIPKIYFIGYFEEYCFAFVEYFPGITLSKLLLSDKSIDVFRIMKEVGGVLSKIQAYSFSEPGFFSKDLSVLKVTENDDYFNFAKECLKSPIVLQQLGKDEIKKTYFHIENQQQYLPKNESHLVHGDFDPSNILINKKDDNWSISAILDWEFSFSGSMLTDVANMLRYAHKMAPAYEQGFLAGLKEARVVLPAYWRTTIDLLSVISLLDCLARSDPTKEPNRCEDICELIKFFLKEKAL